MSDIAKNTAKIAGEAKEVKDEVLMAYNMYLLGKCLAKRQENIVEKAKCDIKEQQADKELELKEEKARLKELRKRRMEIIYLAETSRALSVLEENCKSLIKAFPADVACETAQIKSGLEHNAHQLPIKGIVIAPNESEQIMKILPSIGETLKKLQKIIGSHDETYRELSEECRSVESSISRVITKLERCNSMADEVTSLGLRVCALYILHARNQAESGEDE